MMPRQDQKTTNRRASCLVRAGRVSAGLPVATLALVGALVLSGCASNNPNHVAFDGHFFRAKLSKVKADRAQFTVEVADSGKSLEGAREAGRYQATKYCIANFGSSLVEWENGPDVEDEELVIDGDRLMLKGACKR